MQAILNSKVKTLSDLRSFLGAANFYRRHLKNFTYSSALLTDKLKKTVPWSWGPAEQKCFDELKERLVNAQALAIPQREGELVMITDASDLGGGSVIFQWQPSTLSDHHAAQLRRCETQGVTPQGGLKHNYPDDFLLAPIGNWNWKWNETRQRYDVYEREILAGILTLSSQFRLVAGRKIIWLCDNKAVKFFLDQPPPNNARLRRWYTFLAQFPITFEHLAGLKNEFCDWLSRHDFDAKIQMSTEKLAQEAFARMDQQIDLSIQLFVLQLPFEISETDYDDNLDTIWAELEAHQPQILQGKLWYRTDRQLYCERKLVIPNHKLEAALRHCHVLNGHPGPERTVLIFLQNFFSELSRRKLIEKATSIFVDCHTCILSKPNRETSDRGILMALPIPQCVNSFICIDFIQLDLFNNFDYVLTIVDALSRFAVFVPCNKHVTGEKVFHMIVSEWISRFGKPSEILSDNEIRFVSKQSFYQRSFNIYGIKVSFSIPYRAQSNGLCERTNRSFFAKSPCIVT